MATKTKKEKTEEVEKIEKTEKVEKVSDLGKYFYAVGKRKEAVAQVRLYPEAKKEKSKIVNDKKFEEYFGLPRFIDAMQEPLKLVEMEDCFITAKVSGGGINGQAEAIRLGIARALVKIDENFKKTLRGAGLMTRDARVVERKKPGLKKARRSPQWAKR